MKFRLRRLGRPPSAGWIWIVRRREKWRLRLSTSTAGGCEASAEAAALGEPRRTLYCTLLLLPSRCIPVRFDCARGGATRPRLLRVMPRVPHPGPSTLPAMALRRDWQSGKPQAWSGPGSLFRSLLCSVGLPDCLAIITLYSSSIRGFACVYVCFTCI